jgi:BirA family biotin operon repressor/biotin-[acetyl-CoA-carboxylase] ligase
LHPLSDELGSYRHLAFDQLGSTNDEAMARLRAGDPGDLWISARSQSAGRGRQGRAWSSPPGNLYASLALRLDMAPSLAPQLGFVAGTALAAVLSGRLGGDQRLQIKWPNDIIFAGAKLAGLLLESAVLGDRRLACVVGFGVNCRSHPQGLAYPATDLAAAGDRKVEARLVLAALADAMARRLAVWDRGVGFDVVRAEWQEHAVDLGTPLAVTIGERRVTGTFQGLDAAGRLRLGTDGGRIAIEAGDVFLVDLAATPVT